MMKAAKRILAACLLTTALPLSWGKQFPFGTVAEKIAEAEITHLRSWITQAEHINTKSCLSGSDEKQKHSDGYIPKELYDRLNGIGISMEEVNEIQQNMQGWGFAPEFILSALGQLSRNEDGLTYGPDVVGADLISVMSDQSESGYVYRSDMDATCAKTLEEALAAIQDAADGKPKE